MTIDSDKGKMSPVLTPSVQFTETALRVGY